MAISQGIGLSLATGVRPFLPPLVVGALARADAGVDFTGSDFSFLESVPFLALMLAFTAFALAGEERGPRRLFTIVLALGSLALGSLEFGGSLAGEGYSSGAGLVAGLGVAAIGLAASITFLGRAQARLSARGDPGSAAPLRLLADGATLVAAVVAVLLPPVSYLLLGFCLWVLVERRRRATRKYEGLRVLR